MSGAVTLKQNSEFHRAYGRGKVKTSPVLVTYAVKNRGMGCRTGITAAKKLGSAAVTGISFLLQGSKQKKQKAQTLFRLCVRI